MIEIECVTKQWGNSSLACIIPKEIVKQKNIKKKSKNKINTGRQHKCVKRNIWVIKELEETN